MFRLLFVIPAVVAMLIASPVVGQCGDNKYPDKPLHLVVHTKAGSGMDALMRLLGKILEERLGVPAVVENKPGGGSSVAMTYVATTKSPDYTLHGVSNIQLTTPLTNKVPYDMSSLRPISFLFEDPLVLFVRPDKPWKTADDFLKDVKANPGKYTMGVAQVGSVDYLTVSYYPQKGYKYEVMPLDSGTETLTSVLGGHVDIGIVEPSIAVQQAKAGKIRVLCSFTDERLKSLPDVPTMKELDTRLSPCVSSAALSCPARLRIRLPISCTKKFKTSFSMTRHSVTTVTLTKWLSKSCRHRTL